MPEHIRKPAIVSSAGNMEKIIREFVGNINSQTSEVSIAQMTSPEGWIEPGQCPEFDEYTIVLKGKLKIKSRSEEFTVSEGEGIITHKGEWVQYSTPFSGGAEYIAVCIPAFSPSLVHRDSD